MALNFRRSGSGYFGQLTVLKQLIWLYFLLLIFEGALRKWILPQLSAPLLIIRDPVGILIVWEAYRTQKWPARWTGVMALLIVVLLPLFVLQTAVGDNPWFVGLYGLRSYLLPFLVAFVMGENLDMEDLRRFGAVTLWLVLPMTALEVAQYLSGAGSFLNRGAYAGGGQIGYIGGKVRAAGTFSFVVGSIDFGTMAAAWILYSLAREGVVKKWLLWASAAAFILSIPVIGSRTLVFESVAMLGALTLGALFGVSQFTKALKMIVPIIVLGSLVSFLPIFHQASGDMSERFSQASESEGGDTQSALINRATFPFVDAWNNADFDQNWLGGGMGRGAAAMAALMTGRVGQAQFFAGESEFSRNVIEMGPIVGLGFALFRLILTLYILMGAFNRMRDQEPLALLLAPIMFSSLFFGVLEQPTETGFMVVSVAFSLAALKGEKKLVPIGVMNRRPLQDRIYPSHLAKGQSSD